MPPLALALALTQLTNTDATSKHDTYGVENNVDNNVFALVSLLLLFLVAAVVSLPLLMRPVQMMPRSILLPFYRSVVSKYTLLKDYGF